jgi:hypothetical protein
VACGLVNVDVDVDAAASAVERLSWAGLGFAMRMRDAGWGCADWTVGWLVRGGMG